MNKIIAIFFTLTVLLFATPVYADSASDYIENEIMEWTEIVANDGFNILDTYSGEIGAENITYQLELAAGVYHFYSSGGQNVEDLDLYIYGENRIQLNSDTLPDKIPIVVIKLDNTATVSVEISAWSFNPGFSRDMFCLLVTCEDQGEILSMSDM